MGAGLTYSLVIGATLTAGGSWRPPYLIITLCFVVALVVVATPVPVPEGAREGTFSLAPFTERDVLVPWLHIINAVLTEFTIGIWAVTYLHEVGKASAGSAAVYASVFGVTMFVSRLLLAKVVAVLGEWTVPVSFVIIGAGAAMMCFAPGIAPKTLGLAVAGFGGGSLYPLTVDRFYSRVGHRLDSVAMGAYCALASGVAVTLGPLALGVAADSFTLRWAILVVPALAAIGAVTQRPDPAA
jgi:predicted MFS family arabinose efflux permease